MNQEKDSTKVTFRGQMDQKNHRKTRHFGLVFFSVIPKKRYLGVIYPKNRLIRCFNNSKANQSNNETRPKLSQNVTLV
jgi:hypothetical protein